MAIPISNIETEALLQQPFWESLIKKIHNAQRMHVEELGNVTHSYKMGDKNYFRNKCWYGTVSTSSRNIKCLHKQLQYLHEVTIIQNEASHKAHAWLGSFSHGVPVISSQDTLHQSQQVTIWHETYRPIGP
jgi:hypothetical protein